MTPLVSVVIPAYNPGSFLAEALRSVVAQEYHSWECVVVDDGSSEDLSWVDSVDLRIRRIRRPNRGPAAARNVGVAATVGPYVAFLDSDDVWRSDKLVRQVTLMEADVDVVLCHTGAEVIDSAGQVLRRWPYARMIAGYADLFEGNGVVVSAALVSRSSLIEAGCWNVFQGAAEDFDLWLRLSLLGRFVYDEEPLVQYRRHDTNVSANAAIMATGIDSVLRQHEALARRQGDRTLHQSIRAARRAARRGWGATSYEQARKELRNRRFNAFVRSWITALQLSPHYTLNATVRYLIRLSGVVGRRTDKSKLPKQHPTRRAPPSRKT